MTHDVTLDTDYHMTNGPYQYKSLQIWCGYGICRKSWEKWIQNVNLGVSNTNERTKLLCKNN